MSSTPGEARRVNVSLVLVSHSARLAEGLAELAAQMAPDVDIRAVGGVDGGLGTDFDAVLAALSGECVVLYDLGSARMIAELAIESLAEPGRVALVDAPFVEGTVAAAVAAQGGALLTDVAAAAHGANASISATSQQQNVDPYAAAAGARRSVVVPNELGLHARPAAALARAAAKLNTVVTVSKGERTAAAASVLELLGLDVRQGDVLELAAPGEHAEQALATLATQIESGLGDAL